MSSFRNVCRFNATSIGTGAFVVASHVTGCKTPAEAFAKNGNTYRYHAQSSDGVQWENGEGVYTVSSVTLTRVTIFANSDSTTVALNFATVPQVDVFPSPMPSLEAVGPDAVIPAGTPMLFQVTSAPVGWTKQVTHNDKALRVVSGAASSGGTNSFSSVMAQTVVGAHALTIAELPSHDHAVPMANPAGLGLNNPPLPNHEVDYLTTDHSDRTDTTGSNNTHTHSILMAIQYVDLIIATKDVFAP